MDANRTVNEVTCFQCSSVTHKTWIIAECNHRICETCLQSDNASMQCDTCVRKSVILCNGNPCGCTFESRSLDLQTLTRHALLCTYHLEPCPLMCGFYIKRSSILKHMSEVCKRRVMTCIYCWNSVSHEEYEEHCKQCKFRFRTCPKCNRSGIPIAQFEDHLNTCKSVILSCQFSTLGCNFEGTACELAIHESLQNHMTEVLKFFKFTENAIQDQQVKMNDLMEENRDLRASLRKLSNKKTELEVKLHMLQESVATKESFDGILHEMNALKEKLDKLTRRFDFNTFEEVLDHVKSKEQGHLEKKCQYLESVTAVYDSRMKTLEGNIKSIEENSAVLCCINKLSNSFDCKNFTERYFKLSEKIDTIQDQVYGLGIDIDSFKQNLEELQKSQKNDSNHKQDNQRISNMKALLEEGRLLNIQSQVKISDLEALVVNNSNLHIHELRTVRTKCNELDDNIRSLKQQLARYIKDDSKSWKIIERVARIKNEFVTSDPQDIVIFEDQYQWAIKGHVFKLHSEAGFFLFSKPFSDAPTCGMFRLAVRLLKDTTLLFVVEVLSIGNGDLKTLYSFSVTVDGKTVNCATVSATDIYSPKKWIPCNLSNSIAFCSVIANVSTDFFKGKKWSTKGSEFFLKVSRKSC